ncbi:hypothetical protein ACRRTK_010757 [Alexandromys fortis]
MKRSELTPGRSHLVRQGVELARCTRCFTPEDVSGKAEAADTGADTDAGLESLGSTDIFLEAAAPTCSLCRRDLRNEGSRLLPCQHLLCRDCSRGFMRELGHVTRAYGTVPDEQPNLLTPPSPTPMSCFGGTLTLSLQSDSFDPF